MKYVYVVMGPEVKVVCETIELAYAYVSTERGKEEWIPHGEIDTGTERISALHHLGSRWQICPVRLIEAS